MSEQSESATGQSETRTDRVIQHLKHIHIAIYLLPLFVVAVGMSLLLDGPKRTAEKLRDTFFGESGETTKQQDSEHNDSD